MVSKVFYLMWFSAILFVIRFFGTNKVEYAQGISSGLDEITRIVNLDPEIAQQGSSGTQRTPRTSIT